MAAPTELSLSRVSKFYKVGNKKIKVLDGINLEINKGELSCIIGANGCGKTTLAKIISGIEEISSGEYSKPKDISYLPQQDSLLPWLTIRQNIELPGKISGRLNTGISKRIKKYLIKYNLLKFAEFYPGEISGGMKQKAALIRSIVYRPEIIIMDEPFSALDAITRIEMRQMLADLWQEYKPTILCITHDMDEAIYLSDRIFVMSNRPGKISRTFKVSLTRPRDLDAINLQESIKLKKSLNRMLLK